MLGYRLASVYFRRVVFAAANIAVSRIEVIIVFIIIIATVLISRYGSNLILPITLTMRLIRR
jgi:hypothetical protein